MLLYQQLSLLQSSVASLLLAKCKEPEGFLEAYNHLVCYYKHPVILPCATCLATRKENIPLRLRSLCRKNIHARRSLTNNPDKRFSSELVANC